MFRVNTNEHQIVEKKIKSVNDKKMIKYTKAMMQYCKIENQIDFRQICFMLIEKARENQIKFPTPLVFFKRKKLFLIFYLIEIFLR